MAQRATRPRLCKILSTLRERRQRGRPDLARRTCLSAEGASFLRMNDFEHDLDVLLGAASDFGSPAETGTADLYRGVGGLRRETCGRSPEPRAKAPAHPQPLGRAAGLAVTVAGIGC